MFLAKIGGKGKKKIGKERGFLGKKGGLFGQIVYICSRYEENASYIYLIYMSAGGSGAGGAAVVPGGTV